MQLTVQKLDSEDIFEDRVRIPHRYRQGFPEGSICKLSTSAATKIVEVFGDPESKDPNVYMDLRTRKHFGLSPGAVAEFQIKPVGWWGQLRWSAGHANASTRIAAQLGIISMFLGVLSLLLGVLAIILAK